MLPAGQTKDQAVAGLRASGDDTFADMVSSMDVTPGVGVDFGDVGRVLFITFVMYVVASGLGWLAAYLLNIVVVETIRELRAQVEEKVHRLPPALLRHDAAGVSCSAGSPTTSTTSRRACSRPSPSS